MSRLELQTLAVVMLGTALAGNTNEQDPKYSLPLTFNTGSKFMPEYPKCSLGEISVEETGAGGWSCVINNAYRKRMAVRVQMELNDEDPNKDITLEYYYIVDAADASGRPSRTLVMKGKGGAGMTCRLCGAAEAHAVKGSTDAGKMEVLEGNSDTFSCKRRCAITLYQHRNFNGQAVTVTSNMKDLKATSLVRSDERAHISSIRVDGYGCEARLYDSEAYGTDFKKPACTFINTVKDDPVKGIRSTMAWDMDAMAKACDCSSASGHDCIRSVAIREVTGSGANSYCLAEAAAAQGGGRTKPVDGEKCNGCKAAKDDLKTLATTADAKREALQRLFTAMASVLEE